MAVHEPPSEAPPNRFIRAVTAVHGFWTRHNGLDGVIRVGGAVAVVVTIEALAGYFLWRGTTESVRIPATLGWALQFGLTGGSVVGTRAFHRGRSEDKWWGLATSLTAVVFVVADASMAALLLNDLADVNPGLLAVGVLVETLVIGYLTVHTLMSAPRGDAEPAVAADAVPAAAKPPAEWGPPDQVPELPAPTPPAIDPLVDEPADDPADDEDDAPSDGDADYRLIPWRELTKIQAAAEARRLTARGQRVTQSGKTLDVLRDDIRAARCALGEEPAA